MSNRRNYDYSWKENDTITLTRLYYAIVSGKNLPWKELHDHINKEFGHDLSEEYILKGISSTIKGSSVLRGKEILTIYKLSKAIEKNDQDKIALCRFQLVKIEREKEVIKNAAKNKPDYIVHKKEFDKDEDIKKINEDMDLVIETKKHPDELYKEGKMNFSNFENKVRKSLEDIDLDKYLDFEDAFRNTKAKTRDELEQIYEVVEYFHANLLKNSIYLSSLNTYADQDKIRKLHVEGEEDLKDVYRNSIVNLYNWKVNIINNQIAFYENYLRFLGDILKKDDLSTIKGIQTKYKKFIINTAPYLIEDYEDLLELGKDYKVVTNTKNLSKSKREELDKKYKERYIK